MKPQPTKLTPSQLKLKKVLKPMVESILKEESTQHLQFLNTLESLLSKAAETAEKIYETAPETYWQTRASKDELRILTLLASVMSGFTAGDSGDISYGRKFVKINMPDSIPRVRK